MILTVTASPKVTLSSEDRLNVKDSVTSTILSINADIDTVWVAVALVKVRVRGDIV